jgi:hypothetical protein
MPVCQCALVPRRPPAPGSSRLSGIELRSDSRAGNVFHRVVRNLLGDRLAFDFIRVQDRGLSPTLDYTRQHPRQIHGVGDSSVHPVAGKWHPDMGRLAAQENASVAKAVGDHAASDPVLLSEYFEAERRIHSQDLPDAAIAVGGR